MFTHREQGRRRRPDIDLVEALHERVARRRPRRDALAVRGSTDIQRAQISPVAGVDPVALARHVKPGVVPSQRLHDRRLALLRREEERRAAGLVLLTRSSAVVQQQGHDLMVTGIGRVVDRPVALAELRRVDQVRGGDARLPFGNLDARLRRLQRLAGIIHFLVVGHGDLALRRLAVAALAPGHRVRLAFQRAQLLARRFHILARAQASFPSCII
mmetsp:Transcript_10036/g.29304  ORF Transcript_10036/g.29304 Transcript_10036/m.29304 type:complete len:215 (-) Transcript_10036:389-1033(-)